MTDKQLRDRLVTLALSREKKNQYTQGAKRTKVGSGYSDCSSFVRWCYLQLLGVDIGLNTVAQIQNKRLMIADNCGKTCPKESNLLPGDLLYFRGTDKSRPYAVGHVEMYIGGGRLIGHGSGTGPTRKSMASYCASRANAGKGYIRALRVIPPEAEASGSAANGSGAGGSGAAQPVVPADPMKAGSGNQTAVCNAPEYINKTEVCLITGGQVNVRSGPGTSFSVLRVAVRGERLPLLEIAGWSPVLVDGRVGFVAQSMSTSASNA